MNQMHTPDPVLDAVPLNGQLPPEWAELTTATIVKDATISRSDAHIDETPRGNRLLFGALAIAALYAAGAAAYLIGAYGLSALASLPPPQMIASAFVAVGPAMLIVMLGVAGRELVRFKSMADRLVHFSEMLPVGDSTVNERAHGLQIGIRREIRDLTEAADQALSRLADMEDALSMRMRSLDDASARAQDDVDGLIGRLARERAAVEELGGVLSRQAEEISAVLREQSELVRQATGAVSEEASHHEARLREAIAALHNANSEAGRASEQVAFAVTDQFGDVRGLVDIMQESARHLDKAAASHAQSAQMAKRTVDELTLANAAGTDEMRRAVDTALDQTRRMMEQVHNELRRLAEAGEAEIDRINRAARAARDVAEEGNKAMQEQVDALAARVSELNAGNLGTAARLDASFEARLKAMEAAISGVERRLGDIPRAAEQKARELYRALEEGARLLERKAHSDIVVPRDNAAIARPDRAAAHADPVPGEASRAPETAPRVSQDQSAEKGEWDWRDVLAGMEDRPGQPVTSSTIVTRLKRAGVDISDLFDGPTVAKIARVHRRDGVVDARGLIAQNARSAVRRAKDVLRENSDFRSKAEVFVQTRHRRLQAAIKRRESEAVFALLNDEVGTAYMVLDAALSELEAR